MGPVRVASACLGGAHATRLTWMRMHTSTCIHARLCLFMRRCRHAWKCSVTCKDKAHIHHPTAHGVTPVATTKHKCVRIQLCPCMFIRWTSAVPQLFHSDKHADPAFTAKPSLQRVRSAVQSVYLHGHFNEGSSIYALVHITSSAPHFSAGRVVVIVWPRSHTVQQPTSC